MFRSDLPSCRVSISISWVESRRVYGQWCNQHERRFCSRVLSLISAGNGKLTMGRRCLLQSGWEDLCRAELRLGTAGPLSQVHARKVCGTMRAGGDQAGALCGAVQVGVAGEVGWVE